MKRVIEVPGWVDHGLGMLGWALLGGVFWHLGAKKQFGREEE